MQCISSILVILYLICFTDATPYIRVNDDGNGDVTNGDYDDTNSRRIAAHHQHHHHHGDALDSSWDYDTRRNRPEIIDLTGLDPCESTICEPHEICIVKNRNLPQCISKSDIASYAGINSGNYCLSCEIETTDIPVCGSNGQTFDSECFLRYQACLKNIDLGLICAGECPCPLDLIAQSVEHDMTIDDVTKILGPPHELTVTSLKDDKTSARVVVNWHPPSGYEEVMGENAITDYLIHYSEEGDSEWKSIRTPGSVTSLSVTGLRSNALYYFRIQAQTTSAIGPLSDAVFHRTVHVLGNDDGIEENTLDNEEGDITDDQYASGDREFDDDR